MEEDSWKLFRVGSKQGDTFGFAAWVSRIAAADATQTRL